ncbi:hypothetical protein SPFL3102_02668 [Sporomusaceae bacterium FL31]|nr:hypothetical protein SPFL3101_02643 [Sporomusaceae bacterium FL31]GCE34841.1 hypothetical protein SPFL3102_02668 [Sporomusaceae bacterium]
MSPDEVIKHLKEKLGIEISRATLLRYENQELVSEPSRGGGGTGGRWTNYPEKVVMEAYVAWSLLRGEYGHDSFRGRFNNGKSPCLSPAVIARAKMIYETLEEQRIESMPTDEELEVQAKAWEDEQNRLRESAKIQMTEQELQNWVTSGKESYRKLQEKEAKMTLEDKIRRDAKKAAIDIERSFDNFVEAVWRWQYEKCKYLLAWKASE